MNLENVFYFLAPAHVVSFFLPIWKPPLRVTLTKSRTKAVIRKTVYKAVILNA